MKKVLIVLTMIVMLLALCACGKATDVQVKTEETMKIETPYGDICVPASFEGNVESEVISESPYTLSFCTVDGDVEVFTLIFGGMTDHLLGTLQRSDGNVEVYATFGEMDSGDERYEAYCGYQEGINTVIEHLISDENFAINEAPVEEDTTTFEIETTVVTLQYPAKWKDKVSVNVSDDMAVFSCNGQRLFDLSFVECDGYLLGTYKETPIYIVDYPIATENVSEADLNNFYAMQVDINVILQHLMEDSNFKISQ